MSGLQTMWHFEKPKFGRGKNPFGRPYKVKLKKLKWHDHPAFKMVEDSLEEKYKKHFPLDDEDYVQTNDENSLGGLCNGVDPTSMLQKVLNEHGDFCQHDPIVAIKYQCNEEFPPCFFAHMLRYNEKHVEVSVDPKFIEEKTKELGIDWNDEDCSHDDKWDQFCDACDESLERMIKDWFSKH